MLQYFTDLLFNHRVGLLVKVYRYQIPQWIHNGLVMISCDVPASRKARGISLFSHKTHICDQCKITTAEIQTMKGHDIDSTLAQAVSWPF